MIRFALECDNGHGFDGWFRSGDDHDQQAKRGLLTCPVCNTPKVTKALMAPSVTTGEKSLVLANDRQNSEIMAGMAEMARKLRDGSENVGDKFAEEARKIHYGEAETRGIHGKASHEEAMALAEEGISFLPLPPLPEDQN